MTGRELSLALREGRKVFGTCIVSDSPRWPAEVAKTGIDFVFIDTEHIAIDRAKLSWMCQTYRGLGLAPIVRITSPDPFLACTALDGGACGIIVPYVETVEQVEALRGAVKLRPLKGKRLAEILAGAPPEPELAAYLANASADNVMIINVESQPAIDNLANLVSVPGLDAVLIGPHDLSCSLGIPEKYDDPKFDAAVRGIFATARRHGVGAGIHSWMGIDREVSWATGPEGANFIIHEADLIAMRAKIAGDVAELRKRLGESAAKKNGSHTTI